jgi:hypothetical protein
MRVPRLQLGGFLYAYNPLPGGHAAEQRSEQRGLPDPIDVTHLVS